MMSFEGVTLQKTFYTFCVIEGIVRFLRKTESGPLHPRNASPIPCAEMVVYTKNPQYGYAPKNVILLKKRGNVYFCTLKKSWKGV